MKRGSICKGRCGNCPFSVLVSIPLRLTPTRGLTAFSNLSQAKRRPALVIATLTGDDLILCQITSQAVTDSYAVAITNDNFITGGLNQNSNVRPNRLFTADRGLILYKAGQLKADKLKEIIDKIIDILQ